MPETLPGFSTFSYGFDPLCWLEKRYWAQLVLTVNFAWAARPECRPAAVTQWVPGTAEAGTLTLTPWNAPVALVTVSASSVVSK